MISWMEFVGLSVTTSIVLFLISFLVRRLYLERYYGRIEGRVVVITGCDSGFGYDTAMRLVQKGAIVLAGCFLETSLTKLKEETAAFSGTMVTIPLNLEDDESVDAFVESVKGYLQKSNRLLAGFVNNAGLFCAGPSEWMSRQTMRRIFNVNTIGAMELSNRMAPLLHRTGGRLVSLSSVSAMVHGPLLSVYGASKAALDNFQSSMRVESQRNFSIHLILPGGFRTPLLNPQALRANIGSHWDKAPEDVRKDFGMEYYETLVKNWTEGVVRFANSNPSWVVDNVEHALFATNPRDRYYTGYDAIILFAILSFAPTCFQDFVLRFCNVRFLKKEDKYVKMAVLKPIVAA